ncbi:MAG: CHAT domain-containing protein [Saprospiraceae bacterium]|nr:CHAT domain-containing protein [Saprospiraceae bacterium]
MVFTRCGNSQSLDTVKAEEYIDSLINVANGLIRKNDLEKALEVIAAAEKFALEKFGNQDVAYAACLYNKGRVYYARNEYLEAEKCFINSRTIQEIVLGKENPSYAGSVHSLALLFKTTGYYEKAEKLYLEAHALYEIIFGKEHTDYTHSLNNLALFYKSIGNYEKAEPLYLETKSIRLKILGKDHPDYATTLNNLALLYQDLGHYEKAEKFNLEAKDIREKLLGREHKDYAASLHNLALLYEALGNYEGAEPLSLEAKEIWGKVLGKMHPNYAASVNNLAHLYRLMGNYEKSETLFLESISIVEKILGKEHLQYAASLNNLAQLYKIFGAHDKSDSLFRETKNIYEKSIGKENRNYATCLSNMAELYQAQGNLEKAEPLFLESMSIREKVFGNGHPDYAKSLGHLANLYNAMGNYPKAGDLFLEFATLNQALIRKAINYLSERELAIYLKEFSKSQNDLLAFTHKTSGQKLASSCFDNTLFYKGFLLNAAGTIKRLALSDTNAADKFNQLKSFERQLAIEYAKPVTEQKRVAELASKANDLEKELARSVAGFGEALRQVKWREVQQTLKPGEAVLEFVNYQIHSQQSPDSHYYAALILFPEGSGPVFVPLFEEKSLAGLLLQKSEYVSKNTLITQIYNRGAVPVAHHSLEGLYDIIWKPLNRILKDVNTIYFSPSGLLNKINLGAIPIPVPNGVGTETLADQYQLIVLNSTRQRVIPSQIKKANNDAVLFGGIQFEEDSTLSKMNMEPLLTSNSRGALSFSSIDSTLRGGTWNYLLGTDREVHSVEKIMRISGIKTSLNKGYDATEESFKSIGVNNSPSPRILHIATHGYFFADSKTNSQQSIVNRESEPVFKMSDHPMLRSGLIMAGGNAAWNGKPTPEGSEDGILTAFEISQMKLSNTELVVLSACETGLGDIQGNEGVYGLQRAFKIAGAKYIIMSLWQVPDKQTSMLMITFYKKWLDEKMTIPDAFRAAQKELRESGLDTYQWAGFVLVE